MLSAGMNIRCVFQIFTTAQQPKELPSQHFRKPQDRIEGCAQFMTRCRQKVALGMIGVLRDFRTLGKFGIDLFSGGDIDRKRNRASIG